MIKFENVNVTIQGKRILSDVNLQIQDGEFVLICGESGCGKTTMTKLLNGLIPHFVRDVSVDGTVTAAGKNVAEMPMYEIAELVGSVFQNPKTQFFHTNSNAEMAFGLENSGVEPEYIRERIKNTITELNIEKLADRNVFSMSGGEKQLLAFASVYAMNPQIYVLDEPSANPDMAGIERLSERLKVIKEKGHTVVVAEHRLSWVQQFADRMIYMKEGRIEREFTPSEFGALSDSEREQMGLRSIMPEQIQIPEISGDLENAELKVCNLSFKRKKQMIFQNISLSARAGDIIGITGKNGAGKSTFSKLVCGFETPDSGEILFQGRDLLQENIRHRAKHIGYVMQNPNQMISKTMIFDEVALSLRNMGKSEEEIREKVEETLKVCGLFPFRNWPVSALSFGQKKRVTIASVLVQDPELIILDEPTAGQDFRHYTEIMEFLRGLNEKGVTVVMITHDMHLMLEYTPRALVFADGRLIADRSAAAVLCDPQLIRQAALKETSLFTLANQLGISPAEEFVQRFIEEDREVRSHGR